MQPTEIRELQPRDAVEKQCLERVIVKLSCKTRVTAVGVKKGRRFYVNTEKPKTFIAELDIDISKLNKTSSMFIGDEVKRCYRDLLLTIKSYEDDEL